MNLLSSMYFFTKDTTDISGTILSGENAGNSTLITSTETGYFNTNHHVYGLTIENVRILAVYLNSATHQFKLSKSIIRNSGTYGQWGVVAVGGLGVLDSCTMYNLKGTFIISAGSNNSPSSIITNNTIFNCSTNPPIEEHAIIHIEGNQKARVINNLIYRNNATGVNFGGNGADSMIFVNNTIALNDGYGIKFQTWGGVYTGVLINNISKYNKLNDIYANTVTNGPAVYLKNNFFGISGSLSTTNLISPNNTLLDTLGNIGGDPFFVDTLNNDFRLKPYSTAIGSGFVTPFLLTKDILGRPRINTQRSTPDMGAFESEFKHASPILVSAEGGNVSVRIRWTQSTGSRLARYKVFRSTSPIADNATGGVVTDTIGIGRFEFVDATGLTNLTKYYYRMKTIDSAGIESGMSNEVSVTPNVLPSIPSGIILEKGPGRIGIKWILSTDSNITYELLRRGKDSTVQILFLVTGFHHL